MPTRKGATLELIITDLVSYYHPPTSLPPLQVDKDKPGVDSDHNIVIMAPKSNNKYFIEKEKRIITTRPLPESNIVPFGAEIAGHAWTEVIECNDVDEKVNNFHGYLRSLLDRFFPEKITIFTNQDKNWMTPRLKTLHRQTQREYFKNRRSPK